MDDLEPTRYAGTRFSIERLPEFRRVAEAADDDGRPWTWKGGYPQNVLRVGRHDPVPFNTGYE